MYFSWFCLELKGLSLQWHSPQRCRQLSRHSRGAVLCGYGHRPASRVTAVPAARHSSHAGATMTGACQVLSTLPRGWHCPASTVWLVSTLCQRTGMLGTSKGRMILHPGLSYCAVGNTDIRCLPTHSTLTGVGVGCIWVPVRGEQR